MLLFLQISYCFDFSWIVFPLVLVHWYYLWAEFNSGLFRKGHCWNTLKRTQTHIFTFCCWLGYGRGFLSQIHVSSHPSELNFHQQQTWPRFSQSLSKHALESTKPCRTPNSSTATSPHPLREANLRQPIPECCRGAQLDAFLESVFRNFLQFVLNYFPHV